MDRTPPELCEKIYSFACTDTGYTGRSLSLVSKYIHDTSKPVKLQSIAIHGYDQMLAFAALLDKTPPHLRRVRNLLIASRGWDVESNENPYQCWYDARFELHQFRQEDFTEEEGVKQKKALEEECDRQYAIGYRKVVAKQKEDEVRGRKGASAFESILLNVSFSLETLEVDLEYHSSRYQTKFVGLPRLTDLTTHGKFPLMPESHTPTLMPCRSLRRLHIDAHSPNTHTSYFFHSIATFAPDLTHLCISGLQQDEWLGGYLEVALGLREPGIYESQVARLPETIKIVLIKPDAPPLPNGRCGTARLRYKQLLSGSRALQKKDDRVVLLRARPPSILSKDESQFMDKLDESDWLYRISGADRFWDTRD
jgi:hypothetical protein